MPPINCIIPKTEKNKNEDICNNVCADDQSLYALMKNEKPNLFKPINYDHKKELPKLGLPNTYCPAHCGWICVVSELYDAPVTCLDKNHC